MVPNWYVITGGPCSGKTTTVNLLAARGYSTTIEDARHYLDLTRLEGKPLDDIRSHQREFQRRVLEMQLEQEVRLDPDDLVFLDRAVPDSLAYYRFLGFEPDALLRDALRRSSYRGVFLLELLPLVKDYARTEDAPAQRRIHELLAEVYDALPFPVVRVPAFPAAERVEFILERIGVKPLGESPKGETPAM